MNTDFLNEIIRVACLSFFHSIWQGLVLTLVMALLLRVTEKWGPVFRYRLLGMGYILFVGSFIWTFFVQYHQVSFLVQEDGFTAVGTIASQLSERPGTLSNIISWLEENAFLLMGFWLLVFILKSLLMIRSLVSIHYLRNKDLFDIPDEWRNRWDLILSRLNFTRIPSLYQSGKIHQPMVIGWIKPVILVPVGFFARLSPQEAEAILLHELAHIKRYDYFVNLLQVVIGNLFFFNPFIYWLSLMTRKEREFCSDQWAAERLQDKTILIKALLSFEVQSYNRYTMAFNSGSYPLTQRAERLLQDTRRRISVTAGMFLFALPTMFLFYFLTQLPFNRQKESNVFSPSSPNIPGPNSGYNIKPVDTKAVPFTANQPGKEKGRASQETGFSQPGKDTIPPGASKEWIDGYNAAKNRSNIPRVAKYKIEKSVAPQKESTVKITRRPEISDREKISRKLSESRLLKRSD